MAEDFLEEVYKEAKLLWELRLTAEYIKIRDMHHAVMKYSELVPAVYNIVKRYKEWDSAKGSELNKLVSESVETTDCVLLGDIIEHEMIPLLEESMKQWGEIRTENEEGDFLFVSSASGFLTLKDLKRNHYFHSMVDPMWEARKQAEKIFVPSKNVYSVRGCGLGYLIYQLYEISNGSAMIYVYERDERIIEYALKYGVLDWIPKDNLKITVDESPLSFLERAENDDVKFYIFEPEIWREEEAVRAILEKLRILYNGYKIFEREEEINYYSNLRSKSKMISEFDVSGLNKDFILIAGGPSLDENMDFLRENQGKRTLLAVGTVFKKLLNSGIVPDLVVFLDPQERIYGQIEGAEQSRVPMLLALTAYWKLARNYKGDKYLIPLTNLEEGKGFEEYKDAWESVGTVTALGLEAAIRFGAEQIYLVGVDLAYPGGVSHATGTMDYTEKKLDGLIPTESNDGTTVYTDMAFLSYREQIEEKIEKTPWISYYNMSRTGAKIAGTKNINNT